MVSLWASTKVEQTSPPTATALMLGVFFSGEYIYSTNFIAFAAAGIFALIQNTGFVLEPNLDKTWK